jgi:hypothetical protein
MKKIGIIISIICGMAPGLFAQDISINISETPASIVINTAGSIRVDICNNSPEVTNPLAAYKIIATITVNPRITITGVSNLPSGWSECSNTGQVIQLSNGSDASLQPGQCRTFQINVTAGSTAGAAADITGAITFAGGTDETKCTSGASTVGNLTANDNSKTSEIVTTALPVTLLSFTVQKEATAAQLNWATTMETNSNYFEVQHSADAKAWSVLGTVKSNGESKMQRSYGFTHATPLDGINYYRLKMVDLDGSFAYSGIRNLSFDSMVKTKLYPNPVSSVLTIEATDWSSVASVEMMNTSGVSVYNSGKKPVNMIDVRNLSDGIYILKLIRTNGTVDNLKTIVAR